MRYELFIGFRYLRAKRREAFISLITLISTAGVAIGGFVAGSAYLYAIKWGGMDPWIGIDHLRFGIIGMPVSLVCMIVVSLMTPEPDEETQRMVDEIRVPSGETVLGSSH